MRAPSLTELERIVERFDPIRIEDESEYCQPLRNDPTTSRVDVSS